jgi:hypothetical protein
LQTIIKDSSALCKLNGGIASAALAAAIKFGIESLAGVKGVHFIGEDVEVVCDGGVGVSAEAIVEAIETAGCPRGKVSVEFAQVDSEG